MQQGNTFTSIPRRRFLATGAAALGLAPLAYLRARQAGSPNNEIAMALIGCGGQGRNDMGNFLGIKGVRFVAVCDVDSNQANLAKAKVDGHYNNNDCKIYGHYQDLLLHKGLDAVIVAAPDHQHATIGIAALNAGKDVYGEKPFAWGLAEGRLLVDAVTRNKRVWQTGCQQRSGGEFRRFRALIKNNTLGKLTRFECGTPSGMHISKNAPDDQITRLIGHPPANLDWLAWCGPVKNYPYNPQIHPVNWRWLNIFGGGRVMDWVGHHVDTALWTLGLDHTGPVKVEGKGKLTDHPFFNTYTEYAYQGTFADGKVIEVRSDFMGTRFTGEKGWIYVNRGKLEASDREMLRNVPAGFNTKPPSHYQNFIDCMRSRQLTVAPAECGHRASSFGQLAIVAMDSKQPVHWDPKAEKVIGNQQQAMHPRLSSRVLG